MTDRRKKARDYIFGRVMKINPAFDPEVVAEVLDRRIAEIVADRVRERSGTEPERSN